MKKQVLIGSIIIICGLLIIFTNLSSFQLFPTKASGEAAVASYSISQVEQLIIESSSTNIKLLPADDQETISVSLYKSRNKSPLKLADYVYSEQGNGTLQLEVTRNKKWFKFLDFGSETLEVHIPAELLKKLTVENRSGNIQAEDLSVADRITLEVRSGNIQLNNTHVNHLSAAATSGNLNLKTVNIDKAEIETRSGNISVTSINAEALEVEATSGNISLYGDVAMLDAEVNSGNMDLDLKQLKDNSKLQSSSGNIKLVLETPGSLYVTHKKNSGSTSINKSGFEMLKDQRGKIEGAFGSGDIKLDVETNSGNFRLN